MAVHCFGSTTENISYLLWGKAIQKLTHPYHIKALRKYSLLIQEIRWIFLNSLGACFPFSGFSHETKLLGQVHNSNFYLWVIPYTLQSPTSCIAPNIQKFSHRSSKNNLQRLLKGIIRIIMIKCEPFLLRFLG